MTSISEMTRDSAIVTMERQ